MNRAQEKAQRLLQIEKLLWAHPEGLTRAEIARRLDVNRSTITKYLDADQLPPGIYEDDLDGNKLKMDRNADLTKTSFSLHEVLAIHLATRLLATRTDKQNPHAASALRKLGKALERLDKNVSGHLLHSADVMDGAVDFRDPVYLKVLETLTEAWSAGRKVKLSHQMEDGRIFDSIFSPYFIEPYAVGQTAHVIGWRELPGKEGQGARRTFKIERIRSAEITRDSYTIPADFDPRALLRDAWGIWYTEKEPVEVVLRFHPSVAMRVEESRWHHSQQIEEQPDGSLLWRARIAEPQEMLPWIRGWGADCEVMEPEVLREAINGEVRRLARLYQVVVDNQNPLIHRVLQCWGKTGKQKGEFHPALFHMLDVGYTARTLLEAPASPRWRRALGQALGCDSESLEQWLPYFVALHDIGKVSSIFQGARSEQRARLEGLGFAFGPQGDTHHSVTSQVFIHDALSTDNKTSLPSTLWQVIAACAGGHHGRFLAPDPLKEARSFLKHHEPKEWHELRLTAVDTLKPYLLTKAPAIWPEPKNVSTAIAALTGFTILCDWLGSDNNSFRPEIGADLEEYARISARRAQKAVSATGFLTPSSSSAPTAFVELFADKQPARPLQEAVDAIPSEVLAGSCLAIIEAPTGEGKTEAALALAHRLAQISGTDELYYALPTTATSNQMFGRLQAHLRDRLGLSAQVKLVHGQAFLVEDDLRLDPLGDGTDDHAEAVQEWFGPKKRALLAPFGVGTVDQVELAVLNVKHTALRMIGLAGKVVIFDEVHAYDTYMTTIVEMLLKWLRALGTSVIILSATLPRARRAALARAYSVEVDDAAEALTYPSLWVFGEGANHHASPQAQQPNRSLSLDFLHLGDEKDDVEAKAHWLVCSVAQGGCACWMTNTVRRGQELFEAVDRIAAAENLQIDRMLLHAQYPLAEREMRERALTDKYGPQGDRPKRGIVIGTQVLEQSLDLDFDVMVSDLAPVDLLLQRSGRLHRHDRVRPAPHQTPHLWVNVPQNGAGEIEIGVDRYIYAAFLLKQTWTTLEKLQTVELPRDYRRLVEAVYGFEALPTGHPLQAEWQELKQEEARALGEANLRLLPEPDPEWAFSSRMNRLQFEENDNNAAWIVARTRLGEESITVIPLERRENIAYVWPSGEELPINRPASRDTQLALLRKQLRISNQTVVHALKSEAPPPLFTKSALLKECLPLWLNDGQLRIPLKKGATVLTMDQKLGLIIRKEGA
jgi:CRISPR-associated endonuclease/helicase Cas3